MHHVSMLPWGRFNTDCPSLHPLSVNVSQIWRSGNAAAVPGLIMYKTRFRIRVLSRPQASESFQMRSPSDPGCKNSPGGSESPGRAELIQRGETETGQHTASAEDHGKSLRGLPAERQVLVWGTGLAFPEVPYARDSARSHPGKGSGGSGRRAAAGRVIRSVLWRNRCGFPGFQAVEGKEHPSP